MMKILLIALVAVVCSCANREPVTLPGSLPSTLPSAFLVVDGKEYEMTAGTFCWEKLCSHSFAYTTEIQPVKIKMDSKLEVYFKSSNTLRELYIESINAQYFDPSGLPVEESDKKNKEDIEKFNSRYIIWKANLDSAEDASNIQEQSKITLKPKMRQTIENKYSDGQHIISIGSWWADGDIFFNVLVEVKPW